MAQGAHKITETFEEELAKYTGAPYVIALDNCSNAIFLALYYDLKVRTKGKLEWWNKSKEISIPQRTYMSLPCEIIRVGGKVKFEKIEGETITGAYQLNPTNVWDSALEFTANMFKPGTLQCLSFTGPYKHLKLSKGGAILTDNEDAYKWFKRARFSGRNECSYHEDNFDMLGWNMYLMPEIAARGLLLMAQFYDVNGNPIHNKPLTMKYPDLSKFKIYNDGRYL